MTTLAEELAGLPGAELVAQGLDDLADGRETSSGLLVAIAAPRLRRLGLPVPPAPALPDQPELRLYQLLCREQPLGAYSRYCALRRRLGSFASALEHEQQRPRRSARSTGT